MTQFIDGLLFGRGTHPAAAIAMLIAPPDRRRHLIHCVAPVALTSAAFVFGYWDVFQTMVDQWLTIDANSHGFLIPLVSVALVWARRERLVHASWRPAPVAGLGALCCGIAALALGSLSEIATLRELSMLPTVAGLVLVLFGWSVLRQVYLAILYLAFMMPVLDPFTALHPPLQAFASTIGTALLSLTGTPVLRTENLLYLPNVTIEVAKACSGVNNLVAMTATGIVIAELTLERRRFRVMFTAFALLVALFANPVRVALIGVLLNSGYDKYLPGDGHQVQGLIVSVGAFMLLLGVANVLRPFALRPAAASIRSDRPAPAVAGAVLPRLWLPALACSSLLIVGAWQAVLRSGQEADRVRSAAQPLAVGHWRAISNVSPADLAATPAAFRSSIYGRGDARVAVATDSLFSSGEEPAALASTLAVENKVLVKRSSGQEFTVNLAVIRQPASSVQILYWYQVGDVIVDNRIEARLRGAIGRLVRPWESSKIVAVMAPRAVGGPVPDYLLEFAHELLQASSGEASNAG